MTGKINRPGILRASLSLATLLTIGGCVTLRNPPYEESLKKDWRGNMYNMQTVYSSGIPEYTKKT